MSDFSLYSVSQKFRDTMELLDKDVLEDWEVQNFLDALNQEIEKESSDIIKYYIDETTDISALDKEIKRLQEIKTRKQKKIDNFKEKLSNNMRSLSVKKIASPLGNITLALDSVVEKVEVADDVDFDKLPSEIVKVKKEVSKTEAKKLLKKGVKLDGVTIETTPAKVRIALTKEVKEYQEEAEV